MISDQNVGSFSLERMTLKDQVDRLVVEVNKIAQLIQSSSSNHVVFNALSATKPNAWYLDNRCSHHMFGDKDAFLSRVPFSSGGVVLASCLMKYLMKFASPKEVAKLWMKMGKICLSCQDLETIATFLMLLKLVNIQSATKKLMKLGYCGIEDLVISTSRIFKNCPNMRL